MKSLLAMFFLLLSVSTLENCLAGPVEDIGDLRNTENENVPIEEVDNSARELQQFLEANDVDFGVRTKRELSCQGLQCSCCQRLNIPELKFNENSKNPPPTCFLFPDTGWKIRVCTDFYNMDFSSTALRGCLNLVAKVPLSRDSSLKVGCFNFDRQGNKRVQNFSYDRPALIETATESEAIQAEPPRYQRLNDESQPLNDEDVVLTDRIQELEESWQDA